LHRPRCRRRRPRGAFGRSRHAFVAHGRGWLGGPRSGASAGSRPVSEQRSRPTRPAVVQARQPEVMPRNRY
jgi:hypothetical protein